jgi:pentatricopeptide repeat protein
MKGILLVVTLLLTGLVLGGAGCASDPNVEGAKLDLRNKDYARALENVNTALEKDPQNAEALDLKGRILQEQAFAVNDRDEHSRLIAEMIEAYKQAVAIDPSLQEDIDQRLRLAYYNEYQRGIQAFNRAREDSEQYNDAALYFANASLIQPDSAGAYVNQGIALMNAGRMAEAIEPLENAIEHGEDQPDTYIYLADLYSTNNRADEAVALLENARQTFPDNTDVLNNLLNAYVRANQLDRAKDVFGQAVQDDPNNKLYRYNYGSLLLNTEEYDAAIEQLKAAIALDPQYSVAQYNLGAAYINKAVDVNERIQELDDNLREQRASLSDAQIAEKEAEIDRLVQERRGLFEQAIEPLEQARSIMEAEGEDVTQVCQALFTAYVQTAQQDKAEAISGCAGY